MVVYPPGGVSDQVARTLAELLAQQLGVPVLVENKPGAGGGLAMDLLARGDPDGHTLAFGAITTLELMSANAGRRAPVTPVAAVMRTPVLVVGTPALRGNSFMEMVEQARSRPGAIRWATTGEGTTGHRVLQEVQRASGAGIVHVPYKGGGQQLTDAMGGQFEVLSTNVAALQLDAIKAGKLKALAVGAPTRLQVLPEVPTLADLGFPRANLSSVFGLFAPPRTDPARVTRLNAEVNAALREPGLRARLLEVNNLPLQGSAADFAALIAREAAK